jgi:hypothetical protein
MDLSLFARFKRTISSAPIAGLDERLLLDRDGDLAIYYAPFEHSHESARVVIVGITPGKTQMLAALSEARRLLATGEEDVEILRAIKRTASFSGQMRPNLVAMLNRIGVQSWLGMASCSELFSEKANLVQNTSILRFPVFVAGENYNGKPLATRHPLLRRYLMEHFGEQCKALKNAVFVPLGDRVVEAMGYMCAEGILDRNRVLSGLPHPSTQNSERINYFLGRKRKEDLSVKTDPKKLDAAKQALEERVAALS